MVSGTISLSYQEYFSPFPHGTSSLSVAREYLALGDGPPKFPQACVSRGTWEQHPRSLQPFVHGTITLFGYPFQAY
jgi:hypothetical protein